MIKLSVTLTVLFSLLTLCYNSVVDVESHLNVNNSYGLIPLGNVDFDEDGNVESDFQFQSEDILKILQPLIVSQIVVKVQSSPSLHKISTSIPVPALNSFLPSPFRPPIS